MRFWAPLVPESRPKSRLPSLPAFLRILRSTTYLVSSWVTGGMWLKSSYRGGEAGVDRAGFGTMATSSLRLYRARLAPPSGVASDAMQKEPHGCSALSPLLLGKSTYFGILLQAFGPYKSYSNKAKVAITSAGSLLY
ncbi:hypothetical protein CKAH01_15805 [Colletotrichum kahawae]|uniref:Uncharacterized protein n=1 Tax=Colletotrichum kahawae TaxID=34407 RepID=A0AAD9YHR2_COLKA|nr:hypothetical protein CKAH01_15805 [Colletotrichum kahawae]